MARILYGVSGEGSGHAMRSREVIRYLVKRGHEVRVVTYGRGKELLGDEFPVTEVFGLHLDCQHNTVRYLPSIWKILIKAPEAVKSLELTARLFQTTRPDVVCTDFEPVTALTALRFGVPIISVDNIHHLLFRRSRVPWRYRRDWLVSRAVVRLIVPRANHYVITALDPESEAILPSAMKRYLFRRRARRGVYMVPPIVRPSILTAKPRGGDYILVYDSFKNENLPSVLKSTNQIYRIYGHGLKEKDGNLIFSDFSEQDFLNDLLNCRAIIGTGGFTLISESLVLKKPYLAMPVHGQFEQIDNSLELERLGYGAMWRDGGLKEVNGFLDKIESYRARLDAYHHPGNDHALTLIEGLISELIQGSYAI